VFSDARRAQTPPLGLSQIGNYVGSNAEPGPSSLPKLTMPAPKSSPTRLTFDDMLGAGEVMSGSRGEASPMDLD
jgi:hypothetical protein